MRAKVLRLGVPSVDGREVESVDFRSDVLPVSLVADDYSGSRLVGILTDLAVEGEWVTAELRTLLVDPEEVKGMALQADLDHLETVSQTGDLIVYRGRLCAAHLGTRPCWEGMEL